MDFSQSNLGKIILSNKEFRIRSISEECDAIVKADEFHQPAARSLLGRVSFCEAQCFNRFGAAAVKTIAQKAREHFVSKPLSINLKDKLRWLSDTVSAMRPKVVKCHEDDRPIILFTDGAAESSDPAVMNYDLVSIGGVAFDTATNEIKHFGDMVPKHIVDEWKTRGIQQVITQARA